MNKNFFIFILILIFVFQVFAPSYLSYAVLFVPVYDAGVVKLLQGVTSYLERISETLDENLALLGDELTQLNTRISKILELQTRKEIEQIFSDLQKNILFRFYLNELNKMAEEREIKDPNNDEKYQKALKEAESAGVYLAIQDFPKILSCLPSKTKSEIIAYVASEASKYKVASSSYDVLSGIPECESSSSGLSFSQNKQVHLKLFQPFNLGSLLAQPTLQNQNEEALSFSITPAFDETVLSMQASYIENLLESQISAKADEMREKRKKEIGNIWPVEECPPERRVLIDGGKEICLEYNTVIDVENLKKGLENKFGNPMEAELGSSFIYKELFSPEDILSKLGLTTSSPPSPSYISKEELAKINEFCDFATTASSEEAENSTASSEEAENSTATKQVLEEIYGKCIGYINTVYKNTTAILKEMEAKKMEMAKKQEERSEDLKNKAQDLASKMADCPKGQEDLNEIAQDLDIKIQASLAVRSRVEPQIKDIEKTINEVISIIQKIQNVLQKIGLGFDASIVLNLGLAKKVLNIEGMLKGILDIIEKIPILSDIISIINDFLNTVKGILSKQIFKDIFEDLFGKDRVINIDGILGDIDKAQSKLNETDQKLAKLNFDLQKEGFTSSSILNFSYLLDEYEEKINAYKNFLDAGLCGGGSGQVLKVQNKPKTKIVYRIEGQKEKISPLEKFLNFFSPKLVEINFNK